MFHKPCGGLVSRLCRVSNFPVQDLENPVRTLRGFDSIGHSAPERILYSVLDAPCPVNPKILRSTYTA